MQGHDAYPDPSASSPGAHDNGTTATTVDTSVSALKPYIPPNVPHGLPHVVRYATLSSMDLPLEVRFLIIMIARFADVHGVASVANSTLGEICRIGSHHTVERWISLASDVGILRKEPGKGGKDRKIQQLHVPGRGQELGATAGRPAGHQPHRRPGAGPPAHRGTAGQGSPGRRPGGRAGAAQERPRQRSLRGDQWGG